MGARLFFSYSLVMWYRLKVIVQLLVGVLLAIVLMMSLIAVVVFPPFVLMTGILSLAILCISFPLFLVCRRAIRRSLAEGKCARCGSVELRSLENGCFRCEACSISFYPDGSSRRRAR